MGIKCYKCKEYKNIEEFYRDSTRKLGIMNICKVCDTIRFTQARRKRKELVINHYGGKCACCGISQIQFLTIDHINNDGAIQRKMNGVQRTSGNRFYMWIIKNNFPKDLQVLCWNCNCSKGFYGFDPHQVEIAST